MQQDPNNQAALEKPARDAEVQRKNQQELDDITKKVQEFLKENNLETSVQATRTTQGVELVLQDGLLFRSGEAEILPNGV
ncbi:hypothetical protein ABS198_21350, partial [Acinetobacter baumannii]|uniref:hypothetical protein n=1 Tax=Acinetobacter baumannii TaxID=470 RepID=UPI003332AB2D